jgi:hypothetical protein
LRGQLEQDGLKLLEAAGGLKLAYSNPYKFPFVDLIVIDKQDSMFKLCFPLDHTGQPTLRKAKQWPNEFLAIHEVIPPCLILFEDFAVYAPQNSQEVVKHIYGARALQEVKHRQLPHLINHFSMMTLYQLRLSKG